MIDSHVSFGDNDMRRAEVPSVAAAQVPPGLVGAEVVAQFDAHVEQVNAALEVARQQATHEQQLLITKNARS